MNKNEIRTKILNIIYGLSIVFLITAGYMVSPLIPNAHGEYSETNVETAEMMSEQIR